jgi:hypothetical protein
VVAPLPPVQDRLARSYSGLGIRYPAASGPPGAGPPHPLAGTRLPRGRLTRPDGSTARLYDLFHNGLFVLLEAGGAEGTGGAGKRPAGDRAAGNGPGDNGAAGNGAAGHGAARNDAAGHETAGSDAVAGGLPEQVCRVRYAHCAGTRLPAAALVRPDGYLAWASDEPDTQARVRAARAAARWWCGSG